MKPFAGDGLNTGLPETLAPPIRSAGDEGEGSGACTIFAVVAAPPQFVIRQLDWRTQRRHPWLMVYHTYILASGRNGTLYIGMTNDLVRRVGEHKLHVQKGFTDRYGVTRLVWFEEHATAEAAIAAEKRLKRYKRAWKLDLIEAMNATWDDLYEVICQGWVQHGAVRDAGPADPVGG